MRSRQSSLHRELLEYRPRKWRINLPGRDYRIRFEDLIPALAGAIGKISLVAAFAMAWATGLGITDPQFIAENVRLEIMVGSLFTLVFSAVLNPSASPPGTLAPLIPLIPLMVSAGVHPLPFAILISVAGIIFAWKGFFHQIVAINGPGTKTGVLLLFGILGITSSLQKLHAWTGRAETQDLFFILLILGTAIYLILRRLNAKWLIIPAVVLLTLVVSTLFDRLPALSTPLGLPAFNPFSWWQQRWGIGFGLSVKNFIAALPFALLVMTLWPIDALAVKTLQETNYPPAAKNAVLDMDATFIVVSLRNLVGALLGGSQTAAVWRSFMIPLAVVKRPIGGSAFLLGLMGIAFGILGFPIDISVFPPLVWMVLIFGVFLPLLEIGLGTVFNASVAPVALICIVLGIGVNPVIGWSAALAAENFKLIKGRQNNRMLSRRDKILSIVILLISAVSYGFTL